MQGESKVDENYESKLPLFGGLVGGGQPSAAAHKPCHSGHVAVLTLKNGGTLYLGGWSRGATGLSMAVVDLTGSRSPKGFDPAKLAQNESARLAFGDLLESFPKEKEYPFLRFPVEDFRAPVYSRDQMIAFTSCVARLLKSGMSVGLFCEGGHGRTGTIASVLLWFLYGENAVTIMVPDPITYLRARYCEHVVETQSQVDWVFSTLGLSNENGVQPYKHSTETTWTSSSVIAASVAEGGITAVGGKNLRQAICPVCGKTWWSPYGNTPDGNTCEPCWDSGKAQKKGKAK